ncbi:hypothetical protein C8Q77DRAFT_842399 [Trametes polyzona]|nr:hypothetical protein C8Q77DRAFT_842399 [Trametes polyzona]
MWGTFLSRRYAATLLINIERDPPAPHIGPQGSLMQPIPLRLNRPPPHRYRQTCPSLAVHSVSNRICLLRVRSLHLTRIAGGRRLRSLVVPQPRRVLGLREGLSRMEDHGPGMNLSSQAQPGYLALFTTGTQMAKKVRDDIPRLAPHNSVRMPVSLQSDRGAARRRRIHRPSQESVGALGDWSEMRVSPDISVCRRHPRILTEACSRRRGKSAAPRKVNMVITSLRAITLFTMSS